MGAMGAGFFLLPVALWLGVSALYRLEQPQGRWLRNETRFEESKTIVDGRTEFDQEDENCKGMEDVISAKKGIQRIISNSSL